MIKYTNKILIKTFRDENGEFEYDNSKYTVYSTTNYVDSPNQEELDSWIEVDDLSDENIIKSIEFIQWKYKERNIRLVIDFEQIGVITLYFPELFMLIKTNNIPFVLTDNKYYVYLEYLSEEDENNLKMLGIKIEFNI